MSQWVINSGRRQISKRKKGKIYLIVFAALLMILLILLGYLVYIRYKEKGEGVESAYVDPDAGSWEAGVDAPKEEEGHILIPGYTGAQMKEGDRVLKLRIGNPKENSCYLKASLKLMDGTVLYESGLLKPGTGFDEIELNQTLSAGEYEALVHYKGYTLEDEKELNSSDSAFTLTVNP